MTRHGYIAFDLGAESGRTMLGVLDDDRRLELIEINRFANRPVRLPSGLHWDLTGLWSNLLEGLRRAGEKARQMEIDLVSLGVDTWGVDFALVGRSGQVLGIPHAYRDEHHPVVMQKTVDYLGEEAIYEATGIQFLPFNTLYQLVGMRDREPMVLDHAAHMLNMPDLLHYFFSGEPRNEATVASTTQMVDPRTGQWHERLLRELGLPRHILHEPVPAGTKIGQLRGELAKAAGVPELDVIVPGSHDTASAVAAVPVAADAADWAYLSSGTWSLLGAEMDEPIVTEQARAAGFTNERGVGGKIRLLKNISGLWLVQEVRRAYEAQGQSYDYAQLTDMAKKAKAFRTLVDPDHEPFASPGGMLEKVKAYAKQTGQPVPEKPGQFVRTCLESLAPTYRRTLADLESLPGRSVGRLPILGGAGENDPRDQVLYQGLQKLLVVIVTALTAAPMVFTGGFLPADEAVGQALGIGTFGVQALIFAQIFVGGVLILFLDEIVSKWGVGSGVGLFIIASVSQQIVGGFFSFSALGSTRPSRARRTMA